ncbi:hypothetical protein CEXT_220711 [Caerostris extrusa]|uniref:Uncharacterized protein n=1 Tax=Caerostris extrusa TaxID=172846 RepID=A0AAV4N4M0_CAEEX|nr:hypothetical protein CEXT_220711 [Caerostris extrusa]
MESTSVAAANKANSNNNLQTAGLIPTYSQAGRSLTQVTRNVQAQLTSEQILWLQQQHLVGNSLPPNYNLVTNRVRLPITTTQANNANAITPEILAQAQAQRRNIQMIQNAGNGNVTQNTVKTNLYLQQKRLLEQQKQQRTIPTQQPLDIARSIGTSFPENINDLLNNTVAPNVTLMRSSGIPDAARFNLNSASSLPSPTSQASPTAGQLSPGQRVNQASPFSPLAQQPFPSQTPPPTTSYQAARLSPHPPPSYPQAGPSQSPSPITPTGSSPHMVLSPQSPQWNQRLTTSPIQNMQLQNPMLNAQLSQAPIGANQIRLTAQQRQQLALRSMPSPTSVQNSRGAAVFSSQSDTNFSPVSPVMVFQSQAPQQQRIQRTRMASGSQNQSSFSTTESLLSPQSLPSPSFSQSISTTPNSTFILTSSTSVPVSYSATQAGQHFIFDRQNVQTFTSSPSERSPGVTTKDQTACDAIQQELRTFINSQRQLGLSTNIGKHLLQLSSNSAQVFKEDLEELALLASNSQEMLPSSDTLFASGLMHDSGSLENSVHPTSPRVQVEEPKPPDQKKSSLLQQLLSEPT